MNDQLQQIQATLDEIKAALPTKPVTRGPIPVYLTKRKGSSFFYTRYWEPTTGKEIRKTTGEKSRAAAQEKADALAAKVNAEFLKVFRSVASTVTPSKRFEILRRDGFRCQLCGNGSVDGAKLNVDHKTPRANGGTDDNSNLWTLCQDCNQGKGTKEL